MSMRDAFEAARSESTAAMSAVTLTENTMNPKPRSMAQSRDAKPEVVAAKLKQRLKQKAAKPTTMRTTTKMKPKSKGVKSGEGIAALRRKKRGGTGNSKAKKLKVKAEKRAASSLMKRQSIVGDIFSWILSQNIGELSYTANMSWCVGLVIGDGRDEGGTERCTKWLESIGDGRDKGRTRMEEFWC